MSARLTSTWKTPPEASEVWTGLPDATHRSRRWKQRIPGVTEVSVWLAGVVAVFEAEPKGREPGGGSVQGTGAGRRGHW